MLSPRFEPGTPDHGQLVTNDELGCSAMGPDNISQLNIFSLNQPEIYKITSLLLAACNRKDLLN